MIDLTTEELLVFELARRLLEHGSQQELDKLDAIGDEADARRAGQGA